MSPPFDTITGYGSIGLLVISVHAWTRRQLMREFKERKELSEKDKTISYITYSQQQFLTDRIQRLEERWDDRLKSMDDRMEDSNRSLERRLDAIESSIRALQRRHA